MVGAGNQRSVPVGGRPDVAQHAVNWVCRLGTANRWSPPPSPGLAALTEEALVMSAFLTPRAQRGRESVLEMSLESSVGPEPAARGPPLELPISSATPAPWSH